MDAILEFYSTNGLMLTLFAVVGVILLGIMKYTNMFIKLEEEARHAIYVCIAVLISVIIAGVYLYIKDEFAFEALLLFASNVFALNQTFYNIFKATTLQELLKKALKKFNNISE